MFFLIPYHFPTVGVLVTNHILKDAFLLKCPPWKNGKDLEETKNRKVVENFKRFPMVQSLPNSE